MQWEWTLVFFQTDTFEHILFNTHSTQHYNLFKNFRLLPTKISVCFFLDFCWILIGTVQSQCFSNSTQLCASDNSESEQEVYWLFPNTPLVVRLKPPNQCLHQSLANCSCSSGPWLSRAIQNILPCHCNLAHLRKELKRKIQHHTELMECLPGKFVISSHL